MRIHFVLVTEGSSDEALLPHLENLCIEQGADEVTATAPDLARLADRVGHNVEDKLAAIIELEPTADLIFIHRDADARDAQPRHAEIASAVAQIGIARPYVAIVPVQETEAWLLVSEEAIRRAAYRPNGKRPLNLPPQQSIERTSRPKEVLQLALASASELTGRRLERFKAEFPLQRRLLLLQLPVGGPLESLPSWRQLRADTAAAISALKLLEAGERD